MDLKGLQVGNLRDELTAVVALLRGPGGTRPTLGARIDHTGSAVQLLQERETVAQAERGRTTDILGARDLVDQWSERGLDVRTVLDPTYPQALRDVFDRPALLFLQGSWREERDGWSVAVVGTRSASAEGRSRARRLSRELTANGYPVVSGLARGIDATAHVSALEASGVTHAVLGTGIDHVFPAQHQDLARRIIECGGSLLTQFFPTQGPARWTFPLRNRVMSGLTMATVVVEGGETSGSRIQATRALEHGRPVFLMRSLVDSHAWAQELVEEGLYGARAEILDSSDELLDRLSGRAYGQLAVAL